jgi:hypothetical protein
MQVQTTQSTDNESQADLTMAQKGMTTTNKLSDAEMVSGCQLFILGGR